MVVVIRAARMPAAHCPGQILHNDFVVRKRMHADLAPALLACALVPQLVPYARPHAGFGGAVYGYAAGGYGAPCFIAVVFAHQLGNDVQHISSV